MTGICSTPNIISTNGDQPQATTVGQPSTTDVDNPLSHNANDWTTDIGCSDVVYKLTGTGTTVTLTTRPSGTDWNAVLYVRSASQGCTTDPYAAITDGSERVAGADESISFLAASGVVYYISVAGYGGGGNACSSGSFILNVSGLSAGGTCAAPTVISTSGDQPQATTAGQPSSTDVDNSLSHNANDWTTDIGCSDVVYKLTGAGNTVTLTMRPAGADWNSVLYARSASQGCTTNAYASITDGSEQTAGANESVSFLAASGVAYYISVGGYGVASHSTCSSGSFILNANTGICTPTTCAAQGRNCGSISDGCQGTLTCGSCTNPDTCGGGGVANVCGIGGTPSYGQWAYGAPNVSDIVHAGFKWFNTGYPGTISSSGNTTLLNGGVLPIAYINSSGVPQDDTDLQAQINQYFPGSSWNSINLNNTYPGCTDPQWNVAMVDVRDARWKNWLIARANSAYALGNRGIFWDQGGIENLCGSWGGDTTKQQAAIDAIGSVTSTLRAQHPDLKFIVNGGYGLANNYTSLITGLMEENLLNYCQQTSQNQWCTEEIAKAQAVRALGITIIDMEYINLMGCSDTTCSYATQLINQAAGYGWVPYVTQQIMNYQGRGLTITPPW